MSRKPVDPRSFDVLALIRQGSTADGEASPDAMPRLFEDATAERVGRVHWRVRGESIARVGAEPLLYLHVDAQADVPRVCQRCLEIVTLPVAVTTQLRFVSDEAQAAHMDAESDDDVLALEASHDLLTLVEDEILLALPIVPMHADCHPAVAVADADTPASANPFEVLRHLKDRNGRQ